MVQGLILLLVLALVVFTLWAIIRILRLGEDNASLKQRLTEVELELMRQRNVAAKAVTPAVQANLPQRSGLGESPGAAVLPPASASAARLVEPAPTETLRPAVAKTEAPRPLVAPALAPFEPKPTELEAPVSAYKIPEPPEQTTLPPRPPPVSSHARREPAPSFFDSIDWEQFMGVKLFAWLGGLAGFLAVAFFVKYAFEHNWIPPEVRVAAGFVFAIGLVVGGLKIPRDRFAVTAQTLIATGIVSLYAVTFACSSIYHFAFFGPIVSFLVMSLITTTAFLLAVRLEARVVAVLGILGGFLTPILLATGHDNPLGLFGYLGLLDVGLIAVALHRRWHFLVPLGALGTVIMQIGWAGKFFTDEKTAIAFVVSIAFGFLFLGACMVARRIQRSSPWLLWSAVAMACVCFGFALFFNGYSAAHTEPALGFTLVLLGDLALFALAWSETEPRLFAIAAGGAILTEIAWAAETLTAERAPVIMVVCLAFCAVFLVAYFIARRMLSPNRANVPLEIVWSAVALPGVAILFGFVLLGYSSVAGHPGQLFTFVLLADACLLALAWRDELLPKLHLVAGVAVFAFFAAWTGSALTNALLPWALAYYLAFAVLHAAFPLVLERFRPAAAPTWWSQLFPPLALLLMLGPLFRLEAISILFWPCMLLVDLLAIALALVTASLSALVVVLLLTLGATGVWIFRVPVAAASESELLLVIGGFAVLFFAASTFVVRRLGHRLASVESQVVTIFGDTRSQIPTFSALLPFLLLMMMTERLPLANPSPVFGLAFLLTILVLGLAYVMTLAWLPACALAGVAALEYVWHTHHFTAAIAGAPLFWYLLYYASFTIYPFVFRRRFLALTGPWAVAAVTGVLQFPLVYRLVQQTWPNGVMGVLPALFAIAPLLSLVLILRSRSSDRQAHLNQLALYGGVTLLFITLIFPIQFERQWLTLAWALEGAALLWLFHRVPHRGLHATGIVLLATAFVRLALNPAVLEYHARNGTALFNWYLYSYGIAAAAMYVGARLTGAPRNRLFGVEIPPLLNTLGTILTFLLLNLEIADFFSPPGARVLTFEFSGNFARDMSYTIGWALFALGLLLVSIRKNLRAGRYAALGLLLAALAKLFFHDLARLDALYRVGALMAVAIIAILASFAYQKFLPRHAESPARDS